MVTVTQVPGTGSACREVNSPDGSATSTMPVLGHLEAADLVGRAEPVLGGPDHPEAGVPVAVEGEHHVDQVLQHPRPGDGAVLGDVADDDHRHARARLATRTRAPVTSRTWVTPPGEPSASAVPTVCTESSTISDGLDLLDVAEHRAEVGLGGQVELVGQRVGAAGPQPDLGRGLLAGDVQRASGPPGPSAPRPRAAAWTCRRRARRPAAPPRRAPGRRRAPGPARPPRSGPDAAAIALTCAIGTALRGPARR